jgi:hypothetical protein
MRRYQACGFSGRANRSGVPIPLDKSKLNIGAGILTIWIIRDFVVICKSCTANFGRLIPWTKRS